MKCSRVRDLFTVFPDKVSQASLIELVTGETSGFYPSIMYTRRSDVPVWARAHVRIQLSQPFLSPNPARKKKRKKGYHPYFFSKKTYGIRVLELKDFMLEVLLLSSPIQLDLN